ncbi:Hsp70 family protein [Umezawaea sp. Da 62-37]|uniref:Hsp70 family protein n=1 Tax=Umezawaea sp. Da 62-37 TaxID=3075927 RepID=UPI0028F73392|nr:Hsp70 family protein [Umezawaea sp. Da 62-37]WNV83587.1 Hsp70 family protein [Umezawaea sp. Da 62-37]
MRVLSVDLGTSNTVAVLSAHGRPPRVVEVDGSSAMPSAVYCEEDGTLVVGRDAERRARLDPSRYEPNPKRRIAEGLVRLGGTVVPVTDALAAVLGRVLEETARQLNGAQLDEVRLTHPAQWGPTRRNVLISAARLAGVTAELVLVPEPVAAAAHYALAIERDFVAGQALAVYDLGAGTFDVAVVGVTRHGFEVLANDGLPDLGGLDVDQALLEHVGRQVSHSDPGHWQRLMRPDSTADRRARRTMLDDVRSAKEALSRHLQTEVPMPPPFTDVPVTRADMEALVRPRLLRSAELLASTIASTGMSADQLAGIYLVGGSSRIPLISAMITQQVRVAPTSLDQPETAVALGAHHVPKEGIHLRETDDEPSTVKLSGSEAPTVVTEPVDGGDYPTQNMPATGGFPAQSGPLPVNPALSGPYPMNPALSGPYPVNPALSGPYPVHSGPHPVNTGSHQVNSGPHPVNTGSHQVQSGPHQVNPSSTGGHPVTAPYSVNTSFSVNSPYPTTGPQEFNFPSTVTAKPVKKQPNRKVLLAAGGAVVLVLGVVGGIFALSGPDVPNAQECKTDTATDDKGFTKCLRQLAGVVPDGSTCKSGGAAGVSGVNAIKGSVVSCELADDYAVQYVLTDTVTGAQQGADAVVQSLRADVVEAEWAGNGLEGKYRSSADGGVGLLAFTATDRPLLGIVTKTGDEKLTADDIATYFEQHIQPGT